MLPRELARLWLVAPGERTLEPVLVLRATGTQGLGGKSEGILVANIRSDRDPDKIRYGRQQSRRVSLYAGVGRGTREAVKSIKYVAGHCDIKLLCVTSLSKAECFYTAYYFMFSDRR